MATGAAAGLAEGKAAAAAAASGALAGSSRRFAVSVARAPGDRQRDRRRAGGLCRTKDVRSPQHEWRKWNNGAPRALISSERSDGRADLVRGSVVGAGTPPGQTLERARRIRRPRRPRALLEVSLEQANVLRADRLGLGGRSGACRGPCRTWPRAEREANRGRHQPDRHEAATVLPDQRYEAQSSRQSGAGPRHRVEHQGHT